MKLSIIVPVYNTEKLLPRCVKSLIKQSETDYEIILVNDCSKDNSLEVMNQLKAEYPQLITLVNNKINMLCGGSRNAGMDVAKGEYISFVDSDDYVDTDAYFNMLKLCDGQDLIFSRKMFIKVDNEDKKEVVGFSDAFNFSEEIDINSKKKLLFTSISMVNTFFRKGFLDDNNLRFTNHLAYEDNLLMPQILFKVKTVVSFDEPFYNYCINPRSICTTKDAPHQMDRYVVGDLLCDFFDKNDKGNIYQKEFEAIIIKQCIVHGRKNAIRQYSKPNFEILRMIKKKYISRFPNYKKNLYYKEMFDAKNRFAMNIADLSDRLFVFLFKRKLEQ